MKVIIILNAVLAPLFVSIASTPIAQDETTQVYVANLKFTQSLYNTLQKNQGNIIFSPFSAHAALSMLYQGANGTTKEALSKALYLPSPEVAAEGYSKVMTMFPAPSDEPFETVQVANKAYLLSGIEWQPAFEEAVTKKFHSELQSLDLTNGAVAAPEINGWVEAKTEGKIKDLFSPDDFNSDSRAVLVNTIHFKASWAQPFDTYSTKKAPFQVSNDKQVEADMMFKMSVINFKKDEELDATIIELPFYHPELKEEGLRFGLVAILPNKKDGIADLEAKLDTNDLKKVTDGLEPTHVSIWLPKFKIEQSHDLETVLSEIGLAEIFDLNCDLSNLLKFNESLYVSKAVQKVFMEVNEEGCEAAAATGIEVSDRSAIIGPIGTFKADHPFIIALMTRDKNGGGVPLFVGRVSDPTKSN